MLSVLDVLIIIKGTNKINKRKYSNLFVIKLYDGFDLTSNQMLDFLEFFIEEMS